MADLKTTIAQTENLKNKVKLAKDRINQVVVRGGGITSKSLSEIPNNIKSMLGQYSKLATGGCNIEIPRNGNKSVSIPLNLEFKPKVAFIGIKATFHNDYPNDNHIHYLKIPCDKVKIIGIASTYMNLLEAKNFTIDKQNITFTTSNSSYEDNNSTVVEWYAIG